MTDRPPATTDDQPDLDLEEFSALTFDCYGTLIDWEAGILAALRPWTAAHRVEVGDEELLAAFGRAEARREADDPTAPYRQGLAGVPRQCRRAHLPSAPLPAGDRLQCRPCLLPPQQRQARRDLRRGRHR